jgi:RNA polymerase sigma-70 factor, ECF subfamily
MHVPDTELLIGVAAGDRTAFAAFYDRHASAVFGLLIKMLPQRGDAEDVLQETFLQVWRQASRFDPARSSPFGWVVMIARSRAVDRLRQKAASPTSDPPDRSVLPEAESASERDETAARIRRALALLPAEQRAAIDLAFYGGLTYEEVADRQAIPVGTAKTRIRLGMHRLRSLLSDLTEEMYP